MWKTLKYKRDQINAIRKSQRLANVMEFASRLPRRPLAHGELKRISVEMGVTPHTIYQYHRQLKDMGYCPYCGNFSLPPKQNMTPPPSGKTDAP